VEWIDALSKKKFKKCVSGLPRRKSHHTALSNAAACNSDCPPSVGSARAPGAVGAVGWHQFPDAFIPEVMQTNAAPVTPREPKFTKRGEACPDCRPTRVQNFTPPSFSAAEKSVTVQQTKTQSKLSIPHTTVWWDKNKKQYTL